METYHIEIASISGMTIDVTRKVHDITDAIELAFEEACCDPGIILFIDAYHIEE